MKHVFGPGSVRGYFGPLEYELESILEQEDPGGYLAGHAHLPAADQLLYAPMVRSIIADLLSVRDTTSESAFVVDLVEEWPNAFGWEPEDPQQMHLVAVRILRWWRSREAIGWDDPRVMTRTEDWPP